jgi:hypothetical protein
LLLLQAVIVHPDPLPQRAALLSRHRAGGQQVEPT